MAFNHEEGMSVEAPSLFAEVIQEHLELKRRNAALEHEMPLEKYMSDDPFENHPLFKTEEQARVEDTMDGALSIVDEPTSLDWPTSENSFPDPAVELPGPKEPSADGEEEQSDENLWSRSRDFDWGD
ncbi:MAG TPA: hypothetical protein VG652_10410 [Gaiellaceae bacterium]|nr:hypothetical protein [Gaiellaceae bacterium]